MPLKKSSVLGVITFEKLMLNQITVHSKKPECFNVDLPELRMVKEQIADKVSELIGVKIRRNLWGIHRIGN